jgi:hypothetical protein
MQIQVHAEDNKYRAQQQAGDRGNNLHRGS